MPQSCPSASVDLWTFCAVPSTLSPATMPMAPSPLGHAVDCYLDAIAFAAERVLDLKVVAQVDSI